MWVTIPVILSQERLKEQLTTVTVILHNANKQFDILRAQYEHGSMAQWATTFGSIGEWHS